MDFWPKKCRNWFLGAIAPSDEGVQNEGQKVRANS